MGKSRLFLLSILILGTCLRAEYIDKEAQQLMEPVEPTKTIEEKIVVGKGLFHLQDFSFEHSEADYDSSRMYYIKLGFDRKVSTLLHYSQDANRQIKIDCYDTDISKKNIPVISSGPFKSTSVEVIHTNMTKTKVMLRVTVTLKYPVQYKVVENTQNFIIAVNWNPRQQQMKIAQSKKTSPWVWIGTTGAGAGLAGVLFLLKGKETIPPADPDFIPHVSESAGHRPQP